MGRLRLPLSAQSKLGIRGRNPLDIKGLSFPPYERAWRMVSPDLPTTSNHRCRTNWEMEGTLWFHGASEFSVFRECFRHPIFTITDSTGTYSFRAFWALIAPKGALCLCVCRVMGRMEASVACFRGGKVDWKMKREAVPEQLQNCSKPFSPLG